MHSINIVIVDKENLQIIAEKFKVHSVKLADNNHNEFFAIPIEEFNRNAPIVDFDEHFDFDQTLKPVSEDLNAKYVIAQTDYFGGFGEQSAILVDNNNVSHCERINVALFNLGVMKNNSLDEFDTINLGDYRTNSDFYKI